MPRGLGLLEAFWPLSLLFRAAKGKGLADWEVNRAGCDGAEACVLAMASVSVYMPTQGFLSLHTRIAFVSQRSTYGKGGGNGRAVLFIGT
jgi:hypothetical protein